MSDQESLKLPVGDSALEIAYGTLRDMEMVNITVPGLGVCLEALGLRHFRLYWPTSAGKDEAVDLIYRAGRSIRATIYGYEYGRTMTWAARQNVTTQDTESSVIHISMMAKLLRNSIVRDLQFTALAMATHQPHTLVEWVQMDPVSDPGVNQITIEGQYPDVKPTDDWVIELIETTAMQACVDDIAAVMATVQDSFEREGLVLSLRNMQFPLQ